MRFVFFAVLLIAGSGCLKQEQKAPNAETPAKGASLTDDEQAEQSCSMPEPESKIDIAAIIEANPDGYVPPEPAPMGLKLAEEEQDAKVPDWLQSHIDAGKKSLEDRRECGCAETTISCAKLESYKCRQDICLVTMPEAACTRYGFTHGQKIKTAQMLTDLATDPGKNLPKIPETTEPKDLQNVVKQICGGFHEIAHACQKDKYGCKREGDAYLVSTMCFGLLYREQCVKGGKGPAIPKNECKSLLLMADISTQSETLMRCHCTMTKGAKTEQICTDCQKACEKAVDDRKDLPKSYADPMKENCKDLTATYCDKSGHHPPEVP